MPQIGAAFYELKAALATLYDDAEASAIAHEALRHITGLDRLSRLSQKHQTLTAAQAADFSRMKRALQRGEPLQYAIGMAHFMGRDFKVTAAVLIPRPETEELVQWILQEEKCSNLLDVGTGSGCIAVSLALALPGCAVQAIDISADALSIAEENAERLGARVAFQLSDFLEKASREALGSFDVIVSNPPYIPEAERATLHANVREYEPGIALFVPSDDALLFYRAIADYGKQHLSAAGRIYCELHRDYAEDTAALFRQQGYAEVTLRKDLHGNLRMLRARLLP